MLQSSGPEVRFNRCRMERKAEARVCVEEDKRMSHLYVWAANLKMALKGKSGLEEGEIPGSRGLLYYKTEILSHLDGRLISQHQCE